GLLGRIRVGGGPVDPDAVGRAGVAGLVTGGRGEQLVGGAGGAADAVAFAVEVGVDGVAAVGEVVGDGGGGLQGLLQLGQERVQGVDLGEVGGGDQEPLPPGRGEGGDPAVGGPLADQEERALPVLHLAGAGNGQVVEVAGHLLNSFWVKTT